MRDGFFILWAQDLIKNDEHVIGRRIKLKK